jgi:hypothetical protein
MHTVPPSGTSAPPGTEPTTAADLPANVALLADLRPDQLVAWRKARAHLLAAGVWPIVPPHVEAALRRRNWWRQ